MEIKKEIIKANKSNKRYDEYVENKKNNKKQRTFIERDEFIYIPEKDAYECPKTKNLLEYHGIKVNNDIPYRQYYTNKCKKCPYHDKCTSQTRRTLQDINEPEIEHINQYFKSDEGQLNYPNRGILQ